MYRKQQESIENIAVTVPKTAEKYWKHYCKSVTVPKTRYIKTPKRTEMNSNNDRNGVKRTQTFTGKDQNGLQKWPERTWNRPKWTDMELRWTGMNQNGPKYTRIAPERTRNKLERTRNWQKRSWNGKEWTRNGQKLSRKVPEWTRNGLKWTQNEQKQWKSQHVDNENHSQSLFSLTLIIQQHSSRGYNSSINVS